MIRTEQMLTQKEFEMPTKVVSGVGVIQSAGNEIKKLGVTKAMIVTDIGLFSAGVTKPIEESLRNAGLDVHVFHEIKGEPDTDLIALGAKTYLENNCNGLVAVGGGSSMDTAKAIGVEAVHGEPVLNYEASDNGKPLTKRIPPLTTIPTTAGTGSEVTQWAVIKDPVREIKFNVGGPLIPAHLAIIDPEMHLSMPKHITAATGVDALSHAIECFTMNQAQPITDAVALLAIEYVGKYLRRAYANGHDVEARYHMAQAAMLAGLSYGSDSAGAAHAMAQTLGGMVPVMHGQCVSAMLPPVMEYNWMGAPHKFARIAEALGVNTKEMTVEEAAIAAVIEVERLVADVNIPSLLDQGVDPEQIDRYAQAALDDPQTFGNPRDLDLNAYKWIYGRCLGLEESTLY
ncbi:iron-containing alcohol dehydrogenase [Hazenella sp. IB182357]|uniref:Iron-containing alcohol dehydrogenase n=1 Tax=Polycladospora coralii TaxID=2771432 RepID=A0A926N852_9BACL|nr:iron-containing alcohol dehydrogenase [Polycladospora coralii]MBD1371856.1 iron-containing alcohol dehydrogenase [Polycladospora coralii]MBS7529317.1 iron-containing alcohol dehydrogenase [Polycladospora coralii]